MNRRVPGKADDHSACAQYIRDWFAEQDTDVTVSTARPLVATPYTQPGMTCPHGTTFWMEPTSEQIAQWARDGVR
jgi:hypothetical protein